MTDDSPPGGGDGAPPTEGSASNPGDDVSEKDRLDDDPGFAPAEPTDGRNRGEWRSRYTEPSARRAILAEAIYVGAIALIAPGLMFAVALGWVESLLGVDPALWQGLSHWVYAWLGGLFGGSLFAMKWMYHSVARGIWNLDRRLWRLFTPLLSAGVGFTVVALCASRILPIFGPDVVRTNSGALAVAILIGYFSDQAISRLADIAEGHLGRSGTRSRDAKSEDGKSTAPQEENPS